MYQGYLAIGGVDGVGTTEIFNAHRTYAYATGLVPALGLELPDSYRAPDLPALLGHDEYESPLTDGAPWTDPEEPESYEFLGLYPTAVTGLDDSTWESGTVEGVTDGGVALGGRNAGREILVRGLMIAASDEGMEAGLSWLRNVLDEASCNEGDECGGERMIVMSSAPKACPEAMGESGSDQVHPCLVPYVRQYYRVQATSGAVVQQRWATPCGPMVEVEFLLYAGVPQPHRLPQFVGIAQGEPLQVHENLITNPSFETSLDDVQASTYVTPSRDDSWAEAGDYSLLLDPVREDSMVRRNHVLNPSFEEGVTDWTLDPNVEVTNLVTNPRGRDTSGTTIIRQNLVPNPRGRDTSGTVTLRENLATNPSFEYGTAGWLPSFNVSLSRFEPLYPIEGQWAGEFMADADLAANSEVGRTIFTAKPNTAYSLRFQIRNPGGATSEVSDVNFALWSFNGQGVATPGTGGGPYTLYSGTTEVVMENWIAPDDPGVTQLGLRVAAFNDWAAGQGITIDGLTIVEGPTAMTDYEDGDSTSADPDLTWGWSGTPGESTSVLTAPYPVGAHTPVNGAVYYSAQYDSYAIYAEDGITTQVLAPIPAGGTVVAQVRSDVPTTAQIWFDGGGDTEDFPVDASGWQTIRAGRDPFPSGSVRVYNLDRWTTLYARFAVIPGTDSYTGPYFDAHMPSPDPDWTMQWAGATDQSASQLTAPNPVGWTGGPGILYYSARHDSYALAGGSDTWMRAYTTAPTGSTDVGDQFTWLMEATAEEEGANAYLTIGGSATGGGASSGSAEGGVPVGEWTTTRLGITSEGGAFVWRVQTTATKTVYFRVALIEGTDSYAGPWFDGGTGDGQFAYDWSGAPHESPSTRSTGRTDILARSGDFSVYVQAQSEGVGDFTFSTSLSDIALPVISAAWYVRPDHAASSIRARATLTDSSGDVANSPVRSFQVGGPGWARPSFTLEVPDSAVVTGLRLEIWPASGGWEAGQGIYLDATLVETALQAGPYFDGDFTDTALTTYAWDAEGSTATTLGEVVNTRGYADLTDGQALAYGMLPGRNYHLRTTLHLNSAQEFTQARDARTIQAIWTDHAGVATVVRSQPAPNAVGDHLVTLDFTVPSNVAGGILRLYSGGDVPSWWDAALLSATDPEFYFDGDTPDADGWTYDWSGAAHETTSTATFNPLPPETVGNVVCDPSEVTVVLRRNLAPNPIPGAPEGWNPLAVHGVSFERDFIADDTLVPGGESARVRTLENSGSALYTAYLENVGNAPGERASVQAGRRYTGSVWVKMDRSGRAVITVSMFDAAGTEFHVRYADSVPVVADEWVRMSITTTAPQGAHSVSFFAYTFISPFDPAPMGTLSWFSHMLLEQSGSVNEYFDATFADTAELNYSWEGLPNRSPSIVAEQEVGDLLLDPDCVYPPLPPRPPVITTDCIETPTQWTRYTVLVDKDHVPRWGSTVPVVTLTTGAAAARQARVRFYPLMDPLDPLTYQECDYDSEFVLTYLPPSSEMVIDGVTRRATASVGGSRPVSALHLLTGSQGLPYTWGTLTCDRAYAMTVDIAPVTEDLAVSLDLVRRM